jgi:uncharacterized protein (TIGR02118 family)
MICVSAVYASASGSRFDSDYYINHHARLAEQLLKPWGLVGLRLAIGSGNLAGGPPPFRAISEMHFVSRAAFDEAMERCGAALFEDAKNYTDIEPILQVSILHSALAGENST